MAGSKKGWHRYMHRVKIEMYTPRDHHVQSLPTKCPNCKMKGVYYYRPEKPITKHRCVNCNEMVYA